jgi:AcrR family transcriptional regulator
MPSHRPRRSSRRPRRSNEQRSAETRARLIAAAIDVLYRQGHSAATTIIIAKRARVSRGAMLHQFRTRNQLLVAVASHIVTEQRRMRVERLDGLEPGLPRLYAAADVSWEVQRHAMSIALLELLMGSRSDARLRRGLEPFLDAMPQMRLRSATFMGQDLGTGEIAQLECFLRLHIATLRGLAFETTFTKDMPGLERARELFVRYERQFINELLGRPRKAANQESDRPSSPA